MRNVVRSKPVIGILALFSESYVLAQFTAKSRLYYFLIQQHYKLM